MTTFWPSCTRKSAEINRVPQQALAADASSKRNLYGDPSSAVPTSFLVELDSYACYRNCIWDALGILLSYPLHPPGQPRRLRDAHLYTIKIPMLFMQGTHDAFAQPDLLQRTLARLPTATLHAVDGADHALRVRGRAPADLIVELAAATAEWIRRVA